MAISGQKTTSLAWHNNLEKRRQVGDSAEVEFENSWYCKCGGKFEEYAKMPGDPDYKCLACGQFVDVKGAPDAEEYGAITISQVPYDNYGPGVLLAWRPSPGRWFGCYRKNTKIKSGPHSPTHSQNPTPFYKVRISSFVLLSSLGFLENNQQMRLFSE